MRILVLGGTSFVGRAIVAELIDRGDDLTLFTRGKTGSELFPTTSRRYGDRSSGDYGALDGGSWDAAVDVSAYVPRHVQQAGVILTERVQRYLFISTVSVYDVDAADRLDEKAIRVAPEWNTEEVSEDTYGGLKVACEDDVQQRWGNRATIVRPGVVAGPHDPTDRFTWWVRRAARGGRLPLPGRPDQPVQVVDSRDLARLVAALVRDDRAGAFDAVGPAEPTTLAELAAACATASGTSLQLEPVTLNSANVGAGVPLVLPPAYDALFRRDGQRAREVGLTATPLVQTAADVRAFDQERGEPPLAAGLSAEQEAALREAASRTAERPASQTETAPGRGARHAGA